MVDIWLMNLIDPVIHGICHEYPLSLEMSSRPSLLPSNARDANEQI